MRVIRLRAPGGPEHVALEEAEPPRPASREALVRVHAAAITRGELDWPLDRLPAIPSYELSGVVEEVGSGVAGVAAGDEVIALTPFDRDGVAAEYTVLPAELLVPRPRALSHAESAATPLPALTAWQGLFDHGRLAAGERVLIQGAAGAVGRFAVQLARAAGARVIGAASPANERSVLELGAHEVIDTTNGFEDTMEAVDVVFDTVGASGFVGPAPCCVPTGGSSRWRRSRPREARTSSSSRTAISSNRSPGAPTSARCGPRRSRSSRSHRRVRRSRAASSRADGARSCWRSPADVSSATGCVAAEERFSRRAASAAMRGRDEMSAGRSSFLRAPRCLLVPRSVVSWSRWRQEAGVAGQGRDPRWRSGHKPALAASAWIGTSLGARPIDRRSLLSTAGDGALAEWRAGPHCNAPERAAARINGTNSLVD